MNSSEPIFDEVDRNLRWNTQVLAVQVNAPVSSSSNLKPEGVAGSAGLAFLVAPLSVRAW